MRRFVAFILLAILLGLGAACATGPNDRCFITDVEYHQARRAFERTQSLDVVRRGLVDAHWPPCAINEALYRIDKEFGITDQLPTPAKIRSEEELTREEAQDQQIISGMGLPKVKM